MVGELVHPVTYCLVAAGALGTDEIRTVHSHPQATGQCARFLRERLPAAAVVAARLDGGRRARGGVRPDPLAGAPPHAAIGSRHAAELYGAVVLAEAIEDDEDNATRFAWIARREGAGRRRPQDAPESASDQDRARVLGRRRPGRGMARARAWASSRRARSA